MISMAYSIRYFQIYALQVKKVKTLVDLGAELQARRKELGKTQSELAAETLMRQEVLSRLERGRVADFSVSKLLRLAHALGVEVTLVPATHRPTLDSVLEERKSGANTGPSAR